MFPAKKYGRRGKSALSGVNLTVPPGRVIGLVGPNGTDKSTLLHLACGLSEPTAGSRRSHPVVGHTVLLRCIVLSKYTVST
ncbi:ATP-binding cassette domain-containing protein [Streptomyces nodosus]|uniref:ATP-binding cassette domain-containing protein n=1 Tax=Streptomyces nodosus TaxID=40318 RepID=UPI0034549BF8